MRARHSMERTGKRSVTPVAHAPSSVAGTSLASLVILISLVSISTLFRASAQAQVIINGRPIFVNGAGVIINGAIAAPATPQEPAAPPIPTGDSLRFRDGSEIHGEFKSIQPGPVVHWKHPDAQKEIEFVSTNIDRIRFSQSTPQQLKPSCRVHFTNGDELFADISGLDAEQVTLKTWFSGEAKVRRSDIRSIAFLPKDFVSVYDGPLNAGEWSSSPPPSWWYRDGLLLSRGSGVLSHDFNLKGSFTLDFDLGFSNPFAMMITLYADKTQDYGPNNYVLTLTTNSVDLRRNTPTPVAGSVGRAQLPPPLKKDTYHLTIQCNQAEGSIAVYADHRLVRRFKDNQKFLSSGPRILFTDMTGRPSVTISGVRLSVWDQIEPDPGQGEPVATDTVGLINHDKARGQIIGLGDGKLKLLLNNHQLEVPLQRITQINFANPVAAPTSSPNSVRAQLPGGGSLSFDLDDWTGEKISGQSPIFGRFTLDCRAVRELDFNVSRVTTPSPTSNDEFGGLDD